MGLQEWKLVKDNSVEGACYQRNVRKFGMRPRLGRGSREFKSPCSDTKNNNPKMGNWRPKWLLTTR